jgi:hypothetical protein
MIELIVKPATCSHFHQRMIEDMIMPRGVLN